VNEVIAERAAEDASLKGMTSTMTVALSHGRDLILSHVGDSRAYLLRNGKISRLTRDHTLAERLLDEGFAREDDELLKEFKDILIQSLGIDQIDCRPEVQHYVLQSGDQLLLCTDGLTDLVSDNEIEAVLKRHANAENSCRELVALALDKGGEDNITAVVARYWIPKTEAGNKET
jgi:protein phosphatase